MEEKQTTKTTSKSTYDTIGERNDASNAGVHGRGDLLPLPSGKGTSSPWSEAAPKQKNTHRTKKLYLLLLLIIVLASIGSGTSLLAYQKYNPIYHNDLSLAQSGIQHLRNAAALLATLPKKPLDATAVTKAQLEFSAASTAFNQVNSSLQSLPSLATFLPVYGSRLSNAMHL